VRPGGWSEQDLEQFINIQFTSHTIKFGQQKKQFTQQVVAVLERNPELLDRISEAEACKQFGFTNLEMDENTDCEVVERALQQIEFGSGGRQKWISDRFYSFQPHWDEYQPLIGNDEQLAKIKADLEEGEKGGFLSKKEIKEIKEGILHHERMSKFFALDEEEDVDHQNQVEIPEEEFQQIQQSLDKNKRISEKKDEHMFKIERYVKRLKFEKKLGHRSGRKKRKLDDMDK
jgi:hypothetical protein